MAAANRVPALALFVCTACATGASLKMEGTAMKTRIEAVRESGAYQCAPKALAAAETQLEFLDMELDQGNSLRALHHRDEARKAMVTVLGIMKDCKLDSGDRDGDGVPDDNDACPDIPGPKELLGCPDKDGDKIPDHLDKCPDVPEDFDGNEDTDGCPETEVEDRDGDGIKDPDDKCPDDPEDKDNFQDEDGCPDPDNDGDGVLDPNDKCPDLPETRNGFQDEDGCPDVNPDLVVVNRDLGKIEIKQKVFFDTGKATIKTISYGLLNEVAAALRNNPTMEVVVEGHTDAQGSDSFNLRLSQQRADSVRQYLVGQAVEPERMKAVGFGETAPVGTNETKDGREQNRRVEFTITKD